MIELTANRREILKKISAQKSPISTASLQELLGVRISLNDELFHLHAYGFIKIQGTRQSSLGWAITYSGRAVLKAVANA